MIRSLALCLPWVRRLHQQRNQLLVEREELLAQRASMRAGTGTDTDPALQRQILQLLRYFTPSKAIGFNRIRVGRDGDGGYVMLDDFSNIAHVLSFGIGPDCSWDLDIAQRGIDVHMFDHTINEPPQQHPLFHFNQRMIGTTTSPSTDCIGDLLAALVRPGERAILKIDIEGAEWDVFDHCSVQDLATFSQIICEFHDMSSAVDSDWRERALRVVRKLSSAFGVVHVHGNNYGRMAIIANVPFPDVIEVTFANRSLYRLGECTDIFPTHLDFPNFDQRPDLFIGSLRFADALVEQASE